MRILYFHQHFTTRLGSTGTRSYEMARALIREGHEVIMVCGSFGAGNTGLDSVFQRGMRRGIVDDIDVIEFQIPYSNNLSFWKRSWAFLHFIKSSIKLVFLERYDLVFATSTPLTVGIPGIIARWLRHKPFVFEVRDLWPELPKAMGILRNPIFIFLLEILERSIYQSATRIIALSPGIERGIVAEGVESSNVTMIPNGCDLELFNNQLDFWRPEFVSDDQLLAIYVGTHGLANGLDAVLDAAGQLKLLSRNDICIVLVGEGSEKNRLQSRVQDEQLDNVKFLDPIQKVELPAFMNGADLGLQVLKNVPEFYHGSSPNKFFDYIAAGLPVINNYHGWLADMISNANCGFAIEPDNPVLFAETLIAAADDRQILKTKGKNAGLLAEKAFDRNTLSREWVSWVCN